MNKQKLKELIKLVSDLSQHKDLRWFKDELIKNLTVGKLIGTNQMQDYIKIKSLMIDYNKIDDEKTKEHLKIDCTLMYRHKFGLIVVKREGSNINVLNEGISQNNFNQFCLHAFHQVELLINYFFKRKRDKEILAVIKESKDLKSVQQKVPQEKSFKTIGEKLPEIKEILDLENEFVNVFYQIKEIRNNITHRNEMINLQTVEEEFDKLQEELLDSIDLDTGKKYEYLDLLKSIKRNKNPKLVKYNRLYNSIKLHRFKSNKNYHIVIESLEYLKDKIIEYLKI